MVHIRRYIAMCAEVHGPDSKLYILETNNGRNMNENKMKNVMEIYLHF